MTELVPYRKKRRVSLYILVGCCLFALLFGSWRTVRARRQKALDVFYEDMGVQYDLDVRRQQAYSMVSVALNYLPESDKRVKNLLECREDMTTDSIKKKYKANDALTRAAYELESALSEQNLTERDEGTLKAISAQMNSANMTIGHSDYNQTARAFNEKVMKSPGGRIARLLGVKKLELFE